MTLEEKRQRYLQLTHAMQSGVKYELERDGSSASPKHLRVGINAAMSEHAALGKLLIDKGLITEDEYFDALVKSMEREVRSYEERLSQSYGVIVKLV